MTSLTHSAAWHSLCEAAAQYTANPKDEAWRTGLHKAAQVYAESCQPAKPERQEAGLSGEVVPWGNSKGTPIEKATDKDLRYIIGRMKEALEDPSKERWAPNNRKLLDACEAEMGRR